MNRYSVWCYMLVLILLEIAVKTQMSAHGSSHGNLHKSILVDGVSYNFQELSAEAFSAEDDEQEQTHPLLFDPPYMAFGVRPLGVPHGGRVIIANRGNTTVQFVAVSGSSATFHSSFFEEKVVHPGGNTSFNIVFLGRERGYAETDLFIHTSVGTHKYKVSGTSITSAYRLQPLVGLKLPQNASFSPLIYMHNPHDHALQITEVYCSGGAISLELPGGASEWPQSMWHVPPHTTRPIIAVRYGQPRGSSQATVPHGTHTAYVRIKVNGTSPVLVVAVEVTPGTEAGPYATEPCLDFGMGGTKDPAKQLQLYLGNSSPRLLRVASVSVLPGVSVGSAAVASGAEAASVSGIKVNVLSSALIQPFQDTHIATLTMDWREIFDTGNCSGSLVIRTRSGGHKVVLPYTSQPMLGGLSYNHSVVRFQSSDSNLTPLRTLKLTNEYIVSVYITDIELGDNVDKYFEISDFKPKAIAPSRSTNIFSIRLKNWTDSLQFQANVTLHTNITSLVIPIFVYNGKFDIEMSIPPYGREKDLLDFGLVGTSSITRAFLKLVNTNPVPICIATYGINLEGGDITLLGCAPDDFGNITACSCVAPGHRGVISVSIEAPMDETGYITGKAWITTDHQNHTLKIRCTVAKGCLTLADTVVLESCYAGTVCSHPLRVDSQFHVSMNVLKVETHPPNKKLYFCRNETKTKILVPLETTYIGDLCFDPTINCEDECFTSIDLNTTVGLQWLSRMSLPIDTRPSDLNLLNYRYELYKNLTTKYPSKVTTLTMDTTSVRVNIFPYAVTVVMHWPFIVRSSAAGSVVRTVIAHTVQVGTHGHIGAPLFLTNPSTSRPVLVQLAMDWMMPNYNREDQILRTMPDELRPHCCDTCSPASPNTFHFVPNSKHLKKLPKEFEMFSPHPQSQIYILQPGESVSVSIGFKPEDSNEVSGLLFIRNNLTVVDVVRLIGHGSYPSFRFGHRKPGSSSPLSFEMTEKHLKDCDKNRKLTALTTNLTVKRSFTARNTGNIDITVSNFLINDLECEGYGYKVLNCHGFTLSPNSTRKIDIAFTPDFTLSRIHRTLVLETSLQSSVNFSLLTTLPASLLAQCRDSLPRPSWESFVKHAAMYLMGCVGVTVLFAGFYESDRILTLASAGRAKERSSSDALLDLKSIGQMGTKNVKVNGWDNSYSAQDKKQPVGIKPAPWPSEEKQCPMNDNKVVSNSSAKYEEVIPQHKSKKKVNKKNSSPTVDNGDVQVVVKDKKVTQHSSVPSWMMFSSRNGAKTAEAKETPAQNDAKEVNREVARLSPKQQTQETEKTAEVPKKDSVVYNSTEVKVRNHPQYAKRKQKTKGRSYAYDDDSAKNKRLSPTCCEEDTSSTTTESSNNDEADKENDGSTTSSSKNGSTTSTTKKTANGTQAGNKKKNSLQYNDNYEGDGEDEEYDHKVPTCNQPYVHPFSQKLKSQENTPIVKLNSISNGAEKAKQQSDASKFSNAETSQLAQKQSKSKTSTKGQNSKRDKQQLVKKRSIDKGFVFEAKPDAPAQTNAPNSTPRVSSPNNLASLNCWTENKASFSDVVSRTDASPSLYSTVVTPKHKPNPDRKNQTGINLSAVGNEINAESKLIEKKADLGPIGFYPGNAQKPRNGASDKVAPVVRPARKPQLSTLDESLNLNSSFFFFGGEASSPSAAVHESKSVGVIGQPTEKLIARPGAYSPSGGDFGAALLTPFADADDPLLQPLEEIPTYDDEKALLRSTGLMGSVSEDMSLQPNEYNTSWDLPQPNGPYGRLTDRIYNNTFGGRNVFPDTNSGWSSTQVLWDRPLNPNSAQMISEQTATNASAGNNPNNIFAQGTIGGERDAAEWLWGYSNNASTVNNAPLGAIGHLNSTRPPPGLTHPSQTQEQANYDPFHSLNSIWSPAWTVDPWSTNNQDKKDGNP